MLNIHRGLAKFAIQMLWALSIGRGAARKRHAALQQLGITVQDVFSPRH